MRGAGAGLALAPLRPLLRATPSEELQPNANPETKFSLGLASYTFRAFGLEDILIFMKRLDLEKISVKSVHLALESSPKEVEQATAKIRAAGCDPYSGGVIYMRNEKEVVQAFDYAGASGMRMIVGVPNHELLNLVQQKVQESNIRLAVHNHGPGDNLYPTPESVCQKISGLDSRIGLCLDIGHTLRSGVDPAEAAERFYDRLLDIHIKDVTAASAEGGPVVVGRGVADIPKFLRTLLKLGYSGTVSLEYEKDEKDPLPGAAESVGYIRGALAAIG